MNLFGNSEFKNLRFWPPTHSIKDHENSLALPIELERGVAFGE